MEFPFGHHHRRRHGYDDEPPPPIPPPPAEFGHVHHTVHIGPAESYPPPPEFSYDLVYPPPGRPEPYGRPRPPAAEYGESYPGRYRPDSSEDFYTESNPYLNELRNRPSVRVFSRAETNHSLSIRNGEVILARTDPSDPYQHWIKDEKFSTRVKDEEGLPSFALVNKVTGEAIKHSIGATHPVRLIPYNPDYLDESVLWTESKETGHGYRAIRMVNNIRLNMDAFHGDEDHGGIHDGTTIVLWEWTKGNNQQWKIVPY